MKQHDSIWYLQAICVTVGVTAAIYFVLTLAEIYLLLAT